MNGRSRAGRVATAAATPALAGGESFGVARPPQQGRSRASLERMLDAAEALLIQRGSDDFTLTEVGRVGRVSIGSIYNRFASKDELLHAVHTRAMERMEVDQAKIAFRARSRGTSPVTLIRALLDDVAEFLRSNAPIMRPMMMRAAGDSVVRQRGAEAYERMLDSVAAEMLAYRDEINHPDPERAARAVIQIAYAAFARALGFGMAEQPNDDGTWQQLKEDAGMMAASYLFCRWQELD